MGSAALRPAMGTTAVLDEKRCLFPLGLIGDGLIVVVVIVIIIVVVVVAAVLGCVVILAGVS